MMKYTRPPDGGYGWVVVIISFMSHALQCGIVWTVGVFYVIFLDKVDASKPAIALISSLNTAVYYITGRPGLFSVYTHLALTCKLH